MLYLNLTSLCATFYFSRFALSSLSLYTDVRASCSFSSVFSCSCSWLCVCVCMCMCFVCVCVRGRERDRENGKERRRGCLSGQCKNFISSLVAEVGNVYTRSRGELFEYCVIRVGCMITRFFLVVHERIHTHIQQRHLSHLHRHPFNGFGTLGYTRQLHTHITHQSLSRSRQ